MRLVIKSLLFLVMLSSLGCAAAKPDALRRVEDDLQTAQGDTFILQNAGVELAEAEDSVERAQRLWEDDAGVERVEEAAWTAEKQLDRARVLAGKRASAEARHEAAHADALLRREHQIRRAEQAASQLEDRLAETELKNRYLISELQAQRTEHGIKITLDSDLLFELDQSELKPGAVRRLDRLARFLQDNPGSKIVVEGHTDNTGGTQYNRQLSRERADAVRTYLERAGVSTERMSIRGLGEEYPVASNATAAGRLQNRRVEIRVES